VVLVENRYGQVRIGVLQICVPVVWIRIRMDHHCYSSWLDPDPRVDKNDPHIKKKKAKKHVVVKFWMFFFEG
jgi:hypothetical protein